MIGNSKAARMHVQGAEIKQKNKLLISTNPVVAFLVTQSSNNQNQYHIQYIHITMQPIKMQPCVLLVQGFEKSLL